MKQKSLCKLKEKARNAFHKYLEDCTKVDISVTSFRITLKAMRKTLINGDILFQVNKNFMTFYHIMYFIPSTTNNNIIEEYNLVILE